MMDTKKKWMNEQLEDDQLDKVTGGTQANDTDKSEADEKEEQAVLLKPLNITR